MMKESVFVQTGGTYRQQGDYLIPNLTLSEKKTKPTGIWGQRHLHYCKQYRRMLYTGLLISGKLNDYLYDLNAEAEEMFSCLVKQVAPAEGITEQLKAADQMTWVSRMKNVRERAREAVNAELIFAQTIFLKPNTGRILFAPYLVVESPKQKVTLPLSLLT